MVGVFSHVKRRHGDWQWLIPIILVKDFPDDLWLSRPAELWADRNSGDANTQQISGSQTLHDTSILQDTWTFVSLPSHSCPMDRWIPHQDHIKQMEEVKTKQDLLIDTMNEDIKRLTDRKAGMNWGGEAVFFAECGENVWGSLKRTHCTIA